MSKPHEETWEWEEGVLYDDGKPVVRADAYCDARRARLICAAPDMAMALFEAERVLKAWHKERGEWAKLREQIRSVLAKAGVLP